MYEIKEDKLLYTDIGYKFLFFLSGFSWFSSCSSADLDLRGKGYGFGFVLGVIGFVMRIAWVYVGGGDIRVRLGRVGMMSSSKLRYQELCMSDFWLGLGSGWCLGWI